ncbi:MAG: cytochrome c [Thermodesulfobacteriota bacterium]|nr:cytochrome c [Thermodesulfobacteriota bacterium]
MKKSLLFVIAGLFVMSLFTPVFAGGNADEATALIEKSIAFYKANGKEKALAEISKSDGQFVKGEFYVFVWDLNGTVIAHGANQKLIGKDVSGLKDADGKLFVKEGVDLGKSKGSGWVDYKWTNPVTKKMDEKSTFVKKVDDMIFCCGIYK